MYRFSNKARLCCKTSVLCQLSSKANHQAANNIRFWENQAEKLHWFKKWNKTLDNSNPPFTKWFVGGLFNTCYNALDRHIEQGFGDAVGLFYDSPVTKTKTSFTYSQMLQEVSNLSSALLKMGVGKGDVVLIYMPMIPQALFSMLAASRIGAIHSLVFGGFAAMQLSSRISHAQPKVILTSTFGVEPSHEIPYLPIVRQALAHSHYKPKSIVVYSRPQVSEKSYSADIGKLISDGHNVVDFNEVLLAASNRRCDAIPIPAEDPIYVLYTSGTTGLPKAPVRPSGGHAVALNWSMSEIYGVKPGEHWFSGSDLGWVVGHSYICYAPLLHRNPTLLYEGKPVGTPDAGAYYRLIDEYNLVSVFTSPTAMRAIKKQDPNGNFAKHYDTSALRSFFIAGEHLDPATHIWVQEMFPNIPVIDHWWQTESGWSMATTCLGGSEPANTPPLSSVGKAAPGWQIEVLRDDHTVCKPNELGTIAVRLPLPPGSLTTLFKADDRFVEAYFEQFPGYYNTTDAGYVDEQGHVFVMGRIDDVMNVAGHRLSSGSLEEAILVVDEVAEAAVVGRDDELKGQVPFAYCTLKTVADGKEDEVIDKIRQAVRKNVGAIASLSGGVLMVRRLPKTRSGKTARNTLAKMVNKKPFTIPVTIEDASVYDEIADALKEKFDITCAVPEK